MSEDYSERLFAHHVGGLWRAPLGCVALPVPVTSGVSPGQVVAADMRDIARSCAALRAGGRAAQVQLSGAVVNALPEIAHAVARQTGKAPDAPTKQAMIDALQVDCRVPASILLSTETTALPRLLAALGAGVQAGVIWCPPPDHALLATALAQAVHKADLPPGCFAMLHTRIDATEIALRATDLPVTEV